MLNLFLSGRGRTIFILPVLILIFGIKSFVQPLLLVDSPSYIFSLLDSFFINNDWIKLIIGFFILALVAFYVNQVFNSNGFYSTENTLPSLLFVLMACAWTGFHFFSPLMLSLLFILKAINSLLNVYHQKNILSDVFDAGLFLGFAAILYYPLALFILSFWLFISFNRAFSFREYFFPLLGLSLPFFFMGVVFFYFDIPLDFINFPKTEVVDSLISYGSLSQRIFLVICVLAFVLSLPFFIKQNNRAKVKTKNAGRFILVFLINALLIYVFAHSFFPIHNRELILVLPLVFIIPFYFYNVSPLFKDLLFYFWLIAALFFNIFPSV